MLQQILQENLALYTEDNFMYIRQLYHIIVVVIQV